MGFSTFFRLLWCELAKKTRAISSIAELLSSKSAWIDRLDKMHLLCMKNSETEKQGVRNNHNVNLQKYYRKLQYLTYAYITKAMFWSTFKEWFCFNLCQLSQLYRRLYCSQELSVHCADTNLCYRMCKKNSVACNCVLVEEIIFVHIFSSCARKSIVMVIYWYLCVNT